MRTTRDRRYEQARILATVGYCKTFRDLFIVVPKTVVARDMGIGGVRFERMIHNVEQFTVREIYVMAMLFGAEPDWMMNFIIAQYQLDKISNK